MSMLSDMGLGISDQSESKSLVQNLVKKVNVELENLGEQPIDLGEIMAEMDAEEASMNASPYQENKTGIVI